MCSAHLGAERRSQCLCCKPFSDLPTPRYFIFKFILLTSNSLAVFFALVIPRDGSIRRRLSVKHLWVLEPLNVFFPLLAVITGQHRNGVISARTRIDVLLDTFRRRQPFTHFLSFFLNEVEVQERFLKFQEEVLEKCSMVNRKQNQIFLNNSKWFIIQTGISIYLPIGFDLRCGASLSKDLSLSICLSIYLCMCVVCACLCMVYPPMWRQRLMVDVFLLSCSPPVLRHGLSLNLQLAIWLCRLVSQPLGSFCCCTPPPPY